MSPLKTSFLIAILALASACGRQVVEFELDGGVTDARADASTDAPIDGPIEVRPVVTMTTPSPGASGVSLATTVTATFSKPMNAGTLTMATFVLRQGTTVLTGPVTVNAAGTTATLTPSAALMPGLTYTATITMGAMDSGGLTLAADYPWMFTAALNVLPPTVISTMPAPGATNVAIAVSPTATFSKAMNGATINMTTFTLVQGATNIPGMVMLNGATNTATFDPDADLTAGLVYTARITTGAQDTGGLGLVADHTWTFTAGSIVILPPTVVSTTPAPGALNVPITVSPTALFDQPMNPATINMTTFTLSLGAAPITGTVMLDITGTTATFDPTADLAPGIYTARITIGAQGTSGMALATEHTWMFTVGMNMLAPTVTMTTPLPNALNVPISVSPTATFSQPMNMLTINGTTFTLSLGAMPITGMVTYDTLTDTATFDPTMDLAPGTYTATITTGAQDTNGVALAMAHTWMFTVGMSTACVVPPIVLGTSGAFAVLAGAGVTNTGPSMITGDIGVYPLTSIGGFPPGIHTGNQYPGIAPSDTAQGDLTIAYNDAAGRTLCLVSLIGDMGGMTLPPGLYKSTSFLSLVTGDLVLDAMGDANAVWIFSMASELTVASSRQVTIIGGGSAANVYWQVGSSAVLGTGASFVGTIMADQSISFATGAVLQGRALARIAAVTLDDTDITVP